MARESKKGKRLVLAKKKRSKLQMLFRFDLSASSRLLLVRNVLGLSKLMEKFERNPRRSSRARSVEWCERDMLEMDEGEFRKNFRLTRPSFERLVEIVRPQIQKEETFSGNTVSVERRVAMTLYFLGQGINYRTVANQFGVGTSTVCVIVNETARAIRESLTPELIKFPSSDAELLAAMNSFGFPNCVGAIDGSHIRIKKPEYGTDYFNRKGYYSILLQAICDGNAKFTSISCGHPGSIHDARMLKRSGFYQNVQAKRYLNKVRGNLPIVILGDSAYPQLPWLMVPYGGANVAREQLKFNQAHSSNRIIIENAFGQLKGRFRILLKQIDVEISTAELIVTVCCTLHNFCISEKEQFPQEWLDGLDDEVVECAGTVGDDGQGDLPEDLDWDQNGKSTRDLFKGLL